VFHTYPNKKPDKNPGQEGFFELIGHARQFSALSKTFRFRPVSTACAVRLTGDERAKQTLFAPFATTGHTPQKFPVSSSQTLATQWFAAVDSHLLLQRSPNSCPIIILHLRCKVKYFLNIFLFILHEILT